MKSNSSLTYVFEVEYFTCLVKRKKVDHCGMLTTCTITFPKKIKEEREEWKIPILFFNYMCDSEYFYCWKDEMDIML